jgi:DNA mismatch repair ATPase MutS
MALTKAYLREALTTKQMRVEIYEPLEGQGGRKNNTAWKISKEASPGNIGALEDLLFDKDDLVSNAVSMAIRVTMKDGMRTVGCAFVDVQEKTVGVAQFEETENFSNTEVSPYCPLLFSTLFPLVHLGPFHLISQRGFLFIPAFRLVSLLVRWGAC